MANQAPPDVCQGAMYPKHWLSIPWLVVCPHKHLHSLTSRLPDSVQSNTDLNLQPSVCCSVTALSPSLPAHPATAICRHTKMLLPTASKIAFFSWDSVLLICMPRFEAVAGASPCTPVPSYPHQTHGAFFSGFIISAQLGS